MPDGSVSGIVATPVARAFERAHIPVVWRIVPAARQFAMLKRGEDQVCLLGVYRNAEREAYAKFTKPVFQDSAMIGLANGLLRVPANIPLDDLLDNPGLTVLVKSSISYGPYLDQKLGTMTAQRMMVSAEFETIIDMIRVGRAQLTFIPIEEARYYVDKAGTPISEFQILRFAVMPPGEKRYLACSRVVPDQLIERFNEQIGPLGE